jgi:non-homologous end joining protein Ku
VTEVKTDPEMAQLGKQLIDRQTAKYDPSAIDDRYETRLREMIDAKLNGDGIDLSEPGSNQRGRSHGGTEKEPGRVAGEAA